MVKIKGSVKWYNDEKGFGFVAPDDGGKDVFVHTSEIITSGASRTLTEGQRVELEVKDGPRGPQAANVTPISEVSRSYMLIIFIFNSLILPPSDWALIDAPLTK
ncbi:hypothetical protein BOTBODRAFT_551595 [Botryobasidium botryosum FD-172 SS1]|uniref:CSD domain-containing protein n=1 Tax=Botryobasidium botryosum (strain FD-172 SS1) TaxID=930990 RepID=A0A067MRC2_BOTB1|nr:hypothetical protein BOTBODRAFT_551595 [Botryobasidium botryosum FD-172 SS1]